MEIMEGMVVISLRKTRIPFLPLASPVSTSFRLCFP